VFHDVSRKVKGLGENSKEGEKKSSDCKLQGNLTSQGCFKERVTRRNSAANGKKEHAGSTRKEEKRGARERGASEWGALNQSNTKKRSKREAGKGLPNRARFNFRMAHKERGLRCGKRDPTGQM